MTQRAQSSDPKVKMAIEVGGTFTDLIWIEGDEVKTHKVPSTPHDASIGVIAGLSEALERDLSRLEQLFHGSTVATNAVIERKGCRTAFVTTAGFRDVLALQRQLRPNVYAIACGAVEGAQFGASARAALLARAFAELGRIVVALGGQATTLNGLAGLGDLTLTCTSPQSRNYRYGIALGRGESLASIEAEGIGLVEGVFTAPPAQALQAPQGVVLVGRLE